MSNVYREIYRKYQQDLKENVDLKKYNTFRVGGIASILLEPKNVDMFIDMINICKLNKYNFKIIGNGSNILFQDKVYEEIIITTKKMKSLSIDNNIVTCDCGISIPALSFALYKNSLSGFEKLCGIPGTIGGAIVMNAGAYGREIKDVLKEITVYDKEGNVFNVNADALDLSYRHSNIRDNEYIVLSSVFNVTEGNQEEIKILMDECKSKRIKSQPLEFPNAGSIFKKEGDVFAGRIIDECNLKGFKIGGAMVSEKHANFIVNSQNATCKDVLNLIKYVQNTVFNKFGINLNTEVEII